MGGKPVLEVTKWERAQTKPKGPSDPFKSTWTQWGPQRTISVFKGHPTAGPVGSWDTFWLISIYSPIASNGILVPGDLAAGCEWWVGGCPGYSPSKTCTKGFPLEQSCL